MKYLNHLAVEINTSFVMMGVMNIENTGRNDAVAEHQEAENEARDEVSTADEAKDRAGLTVASAEDRFTVLKDTLAPDRKTDIEEKLAKKKSSPGSSSKNKAGSIETTDANQADEAEPAYELEAGLEAVKTNADAEVTQANADKAANEEIINAQVDAAMEQFSTGAQSGVAEGGSGSLEANGEATA